MLPMLAMAASEGGSVPGRAQKSGDSSKNDTDKLGLPDAIYFQDKTLIIFECKTDSIKKAKEDLKKYTSKLNNTDGLIIYCCSFVSKTNYEIYYIKNYCVIDLNHYITYNYNIEIRRRAIKVNN